MNDLDNIFVEFDRLQNQIQKYDDIIHRLRQAQIATPIEKHAEILRKTAIEMRAVTESVTENVLGFTLAQAKGYWYASRKRDGRNQTVYIGRIRAWRRLRLGNGCKGMGKMGEGNCV